MTLNIEQARQNMIDNQVRPWDVVEMDVLDTLQRVHREDFVPAHCRAIAFTDTALPLGHGEVMMKPVVEGRTLKALRLTGADNVLEIGTGSGFLAACMAHLAAHVTSVDLHADFTAAAQGRLAAARISNVTLETGEAVRDWQPRDHFDVVVVTGAVAAVPERFREWVRPDGRLFVIVGQSPVLTASVLTRNADTGWQHQSMFETDLPYLVHAAPVPAFTL